MIFAKPILNIWMGPGVANQGALVLQILSVGIFINVVNWPLVAYFQVSGRPHLPTKFHFLEVFVYVPLAWFSISSLGITGAALAWTTRMLLDTVLLFGAFLRQHSQQSLTIFSHTRRSLLMVAGLLLTGITLRSLVPSPEVQLIAGILLYGVVLSPLILQWFRNPNFNFIIPVS